jgi:hypothetical protein
MFNVNAMGKRRIQNRHSRRSFHHLTFRTEYLMG